MKLSREKMKIVAVILLCCIVFPALSQDPTYAADGNIEKCTDNGQYFYKPDCKKFVNCFKNLKGVIQNCAEGTKWNNDLGRCDFQCVFPPGVPLPPGESTVTVGLLRPNWF